MASNGKAVTGTAVMARSANEEKKNALNSLTLSAQKVNIAHFPYPAPNSKSRVDSLEPPGWTMFSGPGSYYFAAASMSQGHVHPEKALVVDPDDYPLPPHVIRWPSKSPGRATNLPLATEMRNTAIPHRLAVPSMKPAACTPCSH